MLHILLLFVNFLHPFYVSVTEIRHNDRNKTLEVSSRMFFDDFEAALEKQYHVKIDILKPSDKKAVDRLIDDYVRKHLVLTLDGKKVTLQYTGYEIEEDGAWCYFSVPNIDKINKLTVVNNILFEEHSSQINMLHVIAAGARKSTKLDNPKDKAVFSF